MGKALNFEEIALRIQKADLDENHAIQVVQSPCGSGAEATANFSQLFKILGSPEGSLQVVGDLLFQTLFSGGVLEVFHQCLGRLSGMVETGLRIRLHLSPASPQIISLPWELLYRSETRDFLARNPRTPLVRDLDVPCARTSVPPEPPLRILVIRSDPRDQNHRPNLNSESDRLKAAWGRHPGTVIEFLEAKTLNSLRNKLSLEDFHVLHFMGHGGFDEETGDGVLVFENPQGLSEPVRGAVLAETLKSCQSLRLICLNACDTARIAREDTQSVFSGAASALLLAGFPAVVAMQRPISERAASTFSQSLYSALASGLPVDSATAEARLAIHLDCENSPEWAIPALYMCAREGAVMIGSELCEEPSVLLTLSHLSQLSPNENQEVLADLKSQRGARPEIPEVYFALGLRYLALKSYEQATGSLKEAARRGSTASGLDFCLALAGLGGQQPRRLALSRINEVQKHLESARESEGDRPEVCILLAVIKHDYYLVRGLRIGSPSIEELLAIARRSQDVRLSLQVLEFFVRIPIQIRTHLSS